MTYTHEDTIKDKWIHMWILNIETKRKKLILIVVLMDEKIKHTYTFIHLEKTNHSPKNSEVFEAKECYLLK